MSASCQKIGFRVCGIPGTVHVFTHMILQRRPRGSIDTHEGHAQRGDTVNREGTTRHMKDAASVARSSGWHVGVPSRSTSTSIYLG